MQTFPYKLYDVLESVTSAEASASIDWLPSGNGFVILDKKAFLELIIPEYFAMTKMRSFTRQLNLWGFRR